VKHKVHFSQVTNKGSSYWSLTGSILSEVISMWEMGGKRFYNQSQTNRRKWQADTDGNIPADIQTG
jgi:hypothetical protein